MVEELLSKSGTMETEVATSIADAAMLEVASTNRPHMVRAPTKAQLLQHSHVRPNEVTVLVSSLTRPRTSSTKELHSSISSRFELLNSDLYKKK